MNSGKSIENFNRITKISLILILAGISAIIITILTFNPYSGANYILAMIIGTPILVIGIILALFGIKKSGFKNFISYFVLTLNCLPLIFFYWNLIPFSANMSLIFADRDISDLYLDNSTISDFGLKQIRHFKKLKRINLSNTNISDDAVKYLSTISSLKSINLENTKISNSGLKSFSRFKEINSLDLSNTHITDEGLIHLDKIEKIDRLVLSRNKINGSGLRHLKHVHIESLIIGRTLITDDKLEYLRGINGLTTLFLYNTVITNKGAAIISKMPKIRYLEVPHTQIDDGAAKYFIKLTNLEYLNLTGTNISADGVSFIQSHLPNCSIPWK
jgi:Leucine-rich repeat (LRR) protein